MNVKSCGCGLEQGFDRYDQRPILEVERRASLDFSVTDDLEKIAGKVQVKTGQVKKVFGMWRERRIRRRS